MSKSKATDVLTGPEIQRHTQRILELQKEERQARAEMGRIVAGIGDELIAVKEALDKTPDKTAWQRWLKDHVHYSADTAQNYMRVARFAEKNRSASVFLGLDPTVLYRLAALPDEKAATLTPDTLLTDPQTGRQTALSQMSTRSLDRAQRIMGLLADQLAESVSKPRDAVLSEERALYGAGRASNEGIVNLHYQDLKFYSSGLITPSLME